MYGSSLRIVNLDRIIIQDVLLGLYGTVWSQDFFKYPVSAIIVHDSVACIYLVSYKRYTFHALVFDVCIIKSSFSDNGLALVSG